MQSIGCPNPVLSAYAIHLETNMNGTAKEQCMVCGHNPNWTLCVIDDNYQREISFELLYSTAFRDSTYIIFACHDMVGLALPEIPHSTKLATTKIFTHNKPAPMQ